MKHIVAVELPKGYSEKEVDAFVTGIRNIARVMFPNSTVTVESDIVWYGEEELEVRNGIFRTPAGGGPGADAQVGPRLDGPAGSGVPQPLQGAESRSDGRTEPPTGSGEGSEDDMARGKHRSWPKAWRLIQKVGAGKHFAR